MKRISVQANEDRSQTEGGHAVLLLDGVMAIPPRSTFKLNSADANQTGPDGAVWQDSDVYPLETRLSGEGLEIVLGPDVAEDPGLVAGALMEIVIPEAELRGEFLWPHITPRARPKRKNIAPSRPRRDGKLVEMSARGDAQDGSDASMRSSTSEEIAAPNSTNGERSPVTPASDAPIHAPVNAQVRAEPPPVSALRPTGALMDAHLKALKNATSVPTLPLLLQPNDAGRSIVPFDRKTPGPTPIANMRATPPAAASVPQQAVVAPAAEEKSTAAAKPKPDAEMLAPPLIDPHGAHVNMSTALVFDSNPNDPKEPKVDENPWAWRKDVTAMLSTKFLAMNSPVKPDTGGATSTSSLSTAPVQETQRPNAIAAWVRDNAEAGASYVKRARPPALTSNWMSYGLGLSAAVALGALGLQVAGKLPSFAHTQVAAPPPVPEANPFASVPPAGTFAAPSPAFSVEPVKAIESGSLFDALNAGATSPRGTGAADVTPVKALENANAMLTAEGSARDSAEGAYWLKRYIGGIIGEERNMRVVTQLGSLYAEPSGQPPDFEKARTLWEIASSAGDPVAMCFLGQLHENGLGVELDKKAALGWYEQSKKAGGCASVDDAIARVRN